MSLQIGRPPGYRQSLETRIKISDSLRSAWARGDRIGLWRPPEEHRAEYLTLRNTHNAKEARRIIEEHMAVLERRRKVGA